MSGPAQDEYFVEDVDLTDAPNLAEAFRPLGQEELERRRARLRPSFGSLADPDAPPPDPDASVFDPIDDGPTIRASDEDSDEALYADEQQDAWRDRIGAGIEQGDEQADGAIPWAERIPPESLTDDEPEVEQEPAGLIARVRLAVNNWLDSEDDEDDSLPDDPAAASGLDAEPVPEGAIGRLLARVRGRGAVVEAAEEEEDLSELLQPLSGPELAEIQREVEEAEPVFSQMRRHSHAAGQRAQAGLWLAMATLVLFFAISGPQYLSETLPGVHVPELLRSAPGEMDAQEWRETVKAVLFAIGLLLPFLCLYSAATVFRRLLAAAATHRLADLILGLGGAFLVGFALGELTEAGVIQAAVALAVLGAAEWVYRRVLRGRGGRRG